MEIEKVSEVQVNNKKVAKASFWYFLSSIVLKGLAFLTTPFFSRILSVEEYGLYSNFVTWVTLISIVATLSLNATLLSARFDFKCELKQYILSILLLGTAFTLFIYFIIFTNFDFFIDIFSLDKEYINIMFIYILFSPAYDMFLSEQRFEYKYIPVVLLTLLVAVSSVILSFLLINIMDNNLLARVIGSYLPNFIVSVILYIHYFIKGKRISIQYWKYALPIALPYIVHLISGNILNSSDRTMITKICSPSDTALYSMAYNIALIVSVFWSAFNSAFAPWMTEKINENKKEEIRRVSYEYIALFSFLVIGVMLVAPEAIIILGGEKYQTAKYVIPPVMLGYFFIFIYSLYVNIEQFFKKTIGMSIATVIVAIFNVVSNYFFIQMFGFIAAAYTTLAGYVLLTILHFFLVKKMKMDDAFDIKYIILSAFIMGIISFFSLMLYDMNYIRWCAIAAYVIVFCIVVIKKRQMIIIFLRK